MGRSALLGTEREPCAVEPAPGQSMLAVEERSEWGGSQPFETVARTSLGATGDSWWQRKARDEPEARTATELSYASPGWTAAPLPPARLGISWLERCYGLQLRQPAQHRGPLQVSLKELSGSGRNRRHVDDLGQWVSPNNQRCSQRLDLLVALPPPPSGPRRRPAG